MPEELAERVLEHFDAQPTLNENQYSFHDKDEGNAVARIATSHPRLAGRALDHLILLLQRSKSARTSTALRCLDSLIAEARPTLEALALTGDDWARDFLAADDVAVIDEKSSDTAFLELSTPRRSVPGYLTVGTRAPSDAVLIRGRAEPDRLIAATEMLKRAADSGLASSDRFDYLLAAQILAPDLNVGSRKALFPLAEQIAIAPPFDPAAGDPLRSDETGAVRARALNVAAALAHDDHQRQRMRGMALSLIRGGESSDEEAVRALDALGPLPDSDIAFLAGMGRYARARAAVAWAGLMLQDPGTRLTYLGPRLAADPDAFVRRSLAKALANPQMATGLAAARDILRDDPMHSIRLLVQ